MMEKDIFEQTTVEQLVKGFIEDEQSYTCIFCGDVIEKGIIYPHNERLLEAQKYMEVHIQTQHQSPFHYFIQLNKKMTGLTEQQSHVMKAFYEGKTDQQIQQELAIGSASTIRQYRFALREKERQAKTFLAMMTLLKEQEENPVEYVPIHATATMVDERYHVTREEEEEVLRKLFPNGLEGQLVRFPKKQKQKVIVLRAITSMLDQTKRYTEQELNAAIAKYDPDYVTIRRYLIEYGFVDRENDGSAYWVKK